MFETLDNFLLSIALQRLRSEPEAYVPHRTGAGMDNQTIKKVLAWFDEMILFSDNDGGFEISLKESFGIKTLRDLDYFVRRKIERSLLGSL